MDFRLKDVFHHKLTAIAKECDFAQGLEEGVACRRLGAGAIGTSSLQEC